MEYTAFSPRTYLPAVPLWIMAKLRIQAVTYTPGYRVLYSRMAARYQMLVLGVYGGTSLVPSVAHLPRWRDQDLQWMDASWESWSDWIVANGIDGPWSDGDQGGEYEYNAGLTGIKMQYSFAVGPMEVAMSYAPDRTGPDEEFFEWFVASDDGSADAEYSLQFWLDLLANDTGEDWAPLMLYKCFVNLMNTLYQMHLLRTIAECAGCWDVRLGRPPLHV